MEIVPKAEPGSCPSTPDNIEVQIMDDIDCGEEAKTGSGGDKDPDSIVIRKLMARVRLLERQVMTCLENQNQPLLNHVFNKCNKLERRLKETRKEVDERLTEVENKLGIDPPYRPSSTSGEDSDSEDDDGQGRQPVGSEFSSVLSMVQTVIGGQENADQGREGPGGTNDSYICEDSDGGRTTEDSDTEQAKNPNVPSSSAKPAAAAPPPRPPGSADSQYERNTCPYPNCGKQCQNESRLNQHIRFKHAICEPCGLKFNKLAHLRAHNVKVHGAKADKAPEHRPHPRPASQQRVLCDTCGRSIKRRYIKDHMRTHDPNRLPAEKSHACQTCDKKFASQRDLRLHERTHTGEKPFPCKFCEKSFARPETRRDHEFLHTGKPYMCELCGWSFARSVHLRKHMQTHAEGAGPSRAQPQTRASPRSAADSGQGAGAIDERPFPCPQCEMKFKTKRTLTEHQFRHNGKPHMCQICGWSFMRPGLLQRHMLGHTDNPVAASVEKEYRARPRPPRSLVPGPTPARGGENASAVTWTVDGKKKRKRKYIPRERPTRYKRKTVKVQQLLPSTKNVEGQEYLVISSLMDSNIS